jgi:hypothetical protein
VTAIDDMLWKLVPIKHSRILYRIEDSTRTESGILTHISQSLPKAKLNSSLVNMINKKRNFILIKINRRPKNFAKFEISQPW